ncbi:MAG TPA: carbohydrate kinase [Candidatus Limnocylindrales bacterium]|nr:carbohydrate kinase [Candidatus Limnocylindrales bacterium]
MKVAVAGEALIDFVGIGDLQFQGFFGGSPLNTAIAVARLGTATGYVSQLSTDLFGQRLRQHMEANAVDTRFVLSHPAPSTVAFVQREQGENRYVFLARGAADTLYDPDPMPTLPAETAFLAFGSVSLLAEPSAGSFTRLVEAHRRRLTIVLDPNVRPTLIADAADYRRRLDRWVSMAHLVKLSEEDVAYLAGDAAPDDTIARWLQTGPTAVLLTLGRQGARVFRRGRDPVSVPGFEVDVADTIGAGDTFTAGAIVGLLEHGVVDPAGLAALTDEGWRRVLRFAIAAAAVNCTRQGADPPTHAEVDALLAGPDATGPDAGA